MRTVAWPFFAFRSVRTNTKQTLAARAKTGYEAMPLMPIKLKRVYETPSRDDGVRILVDRLWPRGLSKDLAKIDLWLRDVAPSNELRRWFNHEPEKWDEFRRRYFAELTDNPAAQSVLEEASRSKVTLLFAAKDEERNNAVALREYLVPSKRS